MVVKGWDDARDGRDRDVERKRKKATWCSLYEDCITKHWTVRRAEIMGVFWLSGQKPVSMEGLSPVT